MHGIQKRLLELSKRTNLRSLSLREIGRLVGLENKPQLVKHHLKQLIKKGLLSSEYKSAGIISGDHSKVLSVPILGSANCGEPTRLAEENLEGYLRVSPSLLPTERTGDLFALKAVGDSMNKAQLNNGVSIEDGDLVIIDKGYKIPRNGDYVVSIIDGSANIKRLILDQRNKAVHLISESSTYYPPIVVHAEDDFMINGKVIHVIKKP